MDDENPQARAGKHAARGGQEDGKTLAERAGMRAPRRAGAPLSDADLADAIEREWQRATIAPPR